VRRTYVDAVGHADKDETKFMKRTTADGV